MARAAREVVGGGEIENSGWGSFQGFGSLHLITSHYCIIFLRNVCFSIWLIEDLAGTNKTHPTELTTCTSFEINVHNCKSKTIQVSIYV